MVVPHLKPYAPGHPWSVGQLRIVSWDPTTDDQAKTKRFSRGNMSVS